MNRNRGNRVNRMAVELHSILRRCERRFRAINLQLFADFELWIQPPIMHPHNHFPFFYAHSNLRRQAPNDATAEVIIDHFVHFQNNHPFSNRETFTARNGDIISVITWWDALNDPRLQDQIEIFGALNEVTAAGSITVEYYMRQQQPDYVNHFMFFH